MITCRILGNIHDAEGGYDGYERVAITLPDAALRKRVQRLTASDGKDIGLRLPAGHEALRDGDIVAVDDSLAYVVTVEATDVLVIRPGGIKQMGVVAHTLGNRHLPAQFADEEMIVQYDHTVVDYLSAHAVPFTRERRVLAHPFHHAEHTH